MGFIVKNTSDLNVLDLICPHTCRGCGRLGELLCECCKKDLEKTEKCGEDVNGGWIFMYSRRKKKVFEMVKEYKYAPVRGMSVVLSRMLNEVVPRLDGKVVVVPLPTIMKHRRERGFDHIELLARKLAKMRGYKFMKVLSRANDTVQVGADEETRILQAKTAYKVSKAIFSEITYLLVDDVMTTGASMKEARKLMMEAGAKNVYGTVLIAGEQDYSSAS